MMIREILDKKRGFITLLSSRSYLEGVLVLAYSLQQVHSQYPLIVAITEDLSDDIAILESLKSLNCLIEKIPKISYTDSIKKQYSDLAVLNTASKIEIFRLIDWDKLVYIDADTLIVQNIDFLFNYPDGAMLYDIHSVPPLGLSSLFVFEPRNHIEIDLLEYLIQNTDCLDGGLLGQLWFMVRNDQNYQIPLNILKDYSFPFEDREVYAIHFNNQPKPWEAGSNKVLKFGPYILQYNEYLKQVRRKTKIDFQKFL